ncbi:MAG: beta-galactosidase [Haloarculaceae archaeon]
MSIGVCYFPEHWPEARWETDVAQMAAAGIEYVRMGEFAWAALEPEPGEFDFEWLDTVLDLLADRGLSAVLCTPTATPPKWLVDEHPDVRGADPDGTPRAWGSRRFTCFNSPTYREESERITRRLADRYADHPAVAGWQTDNEYGCHDTLLCYCEDCQRAFREWLRERYGDVDALNEAWGNDFWSQSYDSFSAVEVPRQTPAEHHPARLLAFQRFHNDSVAAFDAAQVEILRDADDEWFVTHNGMGDFGALDTARLDDDLDFWSWDSYPTGFVQATGGAAGEPGASRSGGESGPSDAGESDAGGGPTDDELRAGDPDQIGMNHDRFRRPGGTFWVMEQQPGDINWPPHSPQPADGAMRLWAHHAVAHGAETVSFFRWRRCLQGQEQYHAGLRRRDGSADRGYRDAAAAADELAGLDLGAVDADVALLYRHADLWATGIQPHAPEWDYWAHCRAYYRALRARGLQVDLVGPDADLSGYGAAVAPTLHLADDALAADLRAYVEGGGHLLLGARTGQKTPEGQLHDELAPGPLADLAGLRVERHETLPADRPIRVARGEATYDCRTWADWLAPEEAAAVATYANGAAAGTPAVARNDRDGGTVWTCGAWPAPGLADDLVTTLLDEAGVAYTDRLPAGVRVAERDGHTWVTNFTGAPVTVDAPDGAEWVVGDRHVGAFDVGVVCAPAAPLSVTRG